MCDAYERKEDDLGVVAFGEVVTVEALQAQLASFATLPEKVVAHLRRDQHRTVRRID